MTEEPKDGPTEEELEETRHQEVLAHLQRNRQQSSLEHGAIITRVDDQNRETRAHIGSEVETMRGDLGHIKNYMGRVVKAIKRFLERHGMGSDDL